MPSLLFHFEKEVVRRVERYSGDGKREKEDIGMSYSAPVIAGPTIFAGQVAGKGAMQDNGVRLPRKPINQEEVSLQPHLHQPGCRVL